QNDWRDQDGDFFIPLAIQGGKCNTYIPYAALGHRSAGRYVLVVTSTARSGTTWKCCGRTSFDVDLPAPRPWSRVALVQPALDLCMALARVDGFGLATKVHFVREHFGATLRAYDLGMLREAMKVTPSASVGELVKRALFRMPDLGWAQFLDTL